MPFQGVHALLVLHLEGILEGDGGNENDQHVGRILVHSRLSLKVGTGTTPCFPNQIEAPIKQHDKLRESIKCDKQGKIGKMDSDSSSQMNPTNEDLRQSSRTGQLETLPPKLGFWN